MLRQTRTRLLGLIGTTLALCGPARAAFIAYIADDAAVSGGNDVAVTDNGVGDNFPGSAVIGQINTGALNFDGFTIITNVSQSKALIGSAAAPQMDISFSVTTSDSQPHTLFLYASDTGFTFAPGSFLLTLGGTELPSGNTITGSAYGGTVNTNPADPRAVGPLLGTVGPTSTSPFALATTGTFSPTVNPYALTIGVQITRTTPGTTSGSLTFSVPEPTSLAALACVAGAGLARRRRQA